MLVIYMHVAQLCHVLSVYFRTFSRQDFFVDIKCSTFERILLAGHIFLEKRKNQHCVFEGEELLMVKYISMELL